MVAAAFQGYLIMSRPSVITEGVVKGGWVMIADVRYEYTSFETVGRTKKIAVLDNWKVYEVAEDPSHVFLKMKSFTAERYLVRSDYQIPTEGNVSCAYIGDERVDDEKTLEALTDILTREYDAGTPYYMTHKREESARRNHVTVGFEGCPVGTDVSIYCIVKVDSKWVVVFRDEIGELDGDRFPVTYHEIDEKYYEVFEKNKMWAR